ncbi:MAG: hypothetical protein NZL96_01670 [Patescibacteria group bacterium]|nr:hypothetical protein [Patescibacteria group bacterium]
MIEGQETEVKNNRFTRVFFNPDLGAPFRLSGVVLLSDYPPDNQIREDFLRYLKSIPPELLKRWQDFNDLKKNWNKLRDNIEIKKLANEFQKKISQLRINGKPLNEFSITELKHQPLTVELAEKLNTIAGEFMGRIAVFLDKKSITEFSPWQNQSVSVVYELSDDGCLKIGGLEELSNRSKGQESGFGSQTYGSNSFSKEFPQINIALEVGLYPPLVGFLRILSETKQLPSTKG